MLVSLIIEFFNEIIIIYAKDDFLYELFLKIKVLLILNYSNK